MTLSTFFDVLRRLLFLFVFVSFEVKIVKKVMEAIKLEIPVEQDLINKVGIEAIRQYLLQKLKLLELQQTAQAIGQAILDSGIDWNSELEKARQEAWEEYKKFSL